MAKMMRLTKVYALKDRHFRIGATMHLCSLESQFLRQTVDTSVV
jgi:hypothetical protein